MINNENRVSFEILVFLLCFYLCLWEIFHFEGLLNDFSKRYLVELLFGVLDCQFARYIGLIAS